MDVIKVGVGVIEGKDIFSVTLKNSNKMEVSFLNYGGRITSIKIPDQYGKMDNIVLGYETLDEYRQDTAYLGAICGRVAGRIKQGRFHLDKEMIELTKNDGDHHLHGGINNFSHAVWDIETISQTDVAKVKLVYESKDKEEGYPGTVRSIAYYELNENNQFTITYEGQSSKKTLLDLTNHMYFNLTGDAKTNILNHRLQINSDQFLELDTEALPTGRIMNVEQTPFDLREGKLLLGQVRQVHEQLKLANNGFNHPFILNHPFNQAMMLSEQHSGRKLVVETTCPCVVIYTANYFDDDFLIKNKSASKYLGICLETQGFPNAIHHAHFPTIVLDKGETYQAKTVYTFGLI